MSGNDSLSAEDLRSRLYNSLKEKGLVDALKSQLRNKLVSELRQVGVEQPFHPEPQHSPEGSLLHKASNSLVADHLRRCHYDYSLSVFLPECGVPQAQLFTTRDLLQLLNVSPHSRLYQNLASQSEQNHRKGFLWQMLCEVSSICGHSCKDAGIQTDATRLPPQSSLEEQFRKLDSYYATVGDEQKQKWVAVEERLLSYQRQIEERGHHDVQLQMARFKENELSRMRLEERERGRQEMDRIRKEMELTYRSKADSLSQRERHLEEKLKKEQEYSERETYSQRQSLLAEIEAIRQREATIRRKDEVDLREKTLWEEKMKTKEILVKKREDDARKAEIEYNQKLHDEIKKFKLEEEVRLLDRTKDLDNREMRVRANERRLDDELRTINDCKEELRQKRKTCLELEGELSVCKHDLINARGESELLNNRVREMVDYQIVKEDHAIQKREIDNFKMRIAEISRDLMVERQKNEELLREMTERASRPSPEVYLMKKEVEKVRNEVKQERAIYDHHKNNLEKRYQDEVDRNHDLLNKYEEQTLQLEEMNREIRDLRHQLGDHHTALTNEVYRKAKPSVLQRSDSPCDLENGGYVDPTLIRTSTEPELLFSASHGLINNILDHHHGNHTSLLSSPGRSEDYNYSSDIVEDTKRRLRSLEREAETLEHHYQNFQYRMTAVHDQEEPVPAAPSLVRSRVGPADTSRAEPSNTNQTTPQHHTHRTNTGAANGRPMSSTPSRQKEGLKVEFETSRARSPPSHELVVNSSLLDNSVSTVQSTSPPREDNKRVSHRPLSIEDLERRPGSPDVVIIPASGHAAQTNGPTASRLAPLRLAQQTDLPHNIILDPPRILQRDPPRNTVLEPTRSSQPDPPQSTGLGPDPSLTTHPDPPTRMSLDDAWKDQQAEDEAETVRKEAARRRQEEEDREYEEERRQREEERERREQDAWEREQRALRDMQREQSGEPPEVLAEAPAKPSEDVGEKSDDTKDSQIDPTMLKYMEMVQKTKQHEKESEEVVKKTVNMWNKNKKDKTPSQSEDMSLGVDNSNDDVSDDGDFW